MGLLSDIDMHLFIEKRMKGGISYIAKKNSRANNKNVKCYTSSGFQWLNQKEINGFCLD